LNLFKMFEKHKKSGFSVLEIVVSLALFAFVVLLVNSMFVMSQKTYNSGSNKSELAQNVRVSLDRLSREVRQAEEIITALPATDDDTDFPPTNELFFQNGHDISQTTYIRYYLDGSNLMRSEISYYFSSDPSIYVRWDSLDESSQPPDTLVLENNIVGEYFSNLEFWGEDNLINISCLLNKRDTSLEVDTKVFSRN